MNKIKGVNLGGWFVLERWMSPTLFEEIEGQDETQFVLKIDNAKQKLQKHWKTWITEEDFKWISDIRLNLVRIPIPYWLFGDIEPYFGCVEYLDLAMKWAEKYDLKVMLDLHTAPGCQNGFDNGGMLGVMDWHKDSKNINLTIEILGKIAKRYQNYSSLYAIQVLNEPHYNIDIDLIKDFYIKAYTEIRKYVSDEIKVVFHDSFRINEWDTFFTGNSLKNVILDTHQYQCFDKRHIEFSYDEHINFSLTEKKKVLDQKEENIPIICGEWSLGIRHYNEQDDSKNLFRDMYMKAQLYSFNNTTGWIFWSYKTEDRDDWNFRKLYDDGFFPEYILK